MAPRSPPKRNRKHDRNRAPTPHDHLFRYVFSKPRHAGPLLRHLLPTAIARRLDWTTLVLVPGTYVDARLSGSASDVLLTLRLRRSKQRMLVYLLFEHQSSVDRMMALRLLEYACRAWSDYRERTDAIANHLPALVPILLHQGPGRWRAPRRLSELHRLPGVRSTALPTFIELHMLVHELGHDDLPAHELTVLVRVTLALMKLVAAGEITRAHAALLARWFNEVRSHHGHDAVCALTHYLFHSGQDERIIDAIATEATPKVRASMTTIAEKLRAKGKAEGKLEGKAEGKLEGKAEGKLELVRQLLVLRYGELPPLVTRRVGNGTLDELDRWAARLLTATTLDDVFTATDDT